MHHLQQQQQQQQQALLAAQATFAQGTPRSSPPPPSPSPSSHPVVASTPAPAPASQYPNSTVRSNAPASMSIVNRLPSALKASNPNPNSSSTPSANNTSTLGSSGVQIQNGSFYVPRGAVSSEIKPAPKHIERQRRPSVDFNLNNGGNGAPPQSSQRPTSRESEDTNSTDTGVSSEIDEAALAQHTELGNRLSQMSNLLKGFGAPVAPPAVAPPAQRHPANTPVEVASSSRPAGSVYRPPVPLGMPEQKINEVPSSNANNININYIPSQPRLPSAVVPSKWANRVNSTQGAPINNQAESKNHLSIDTSIVSSQSRTNPVLSIDPPSSASHTNNANNSFNDSVSTPGSARNGPVSASAFLNSLKKPVAPSTGNNNAQTPLAPGSVGSVNDANKFSSQGTFTPRASDYKT